MYAHAQLSYVYLASTLDVTRVMKYTMLPPSLAETVWERGYFLIAHCNLNLCIIDNSYIPPWGYCLHIGVV